MPQQHQTPGAVIALRETRMRAGRIDEDVGKSPILCNQQAPVKIGSISDSWVIGSVQPLRRCCVDIVTVRFEQHGCARRHVFIELDFHSLVVEMGKFSSRARAAP